MALVAAMRFKIERIINDRHKEVGGADNAGAIAQIVHRRIVAGFITHKQIRINKLRLLTVQDGFQHFGEILQPQPAPWLYWVKRIEFSLMDISCQCNPGMVTLIP